MTVAAPKPEPLPRDWVTIIYFSFIHLVALLALLPQFFSWQAVGILLLFHWITGGLGVTLGLHRLVAHRSFEVPKWLEYFLVLCGTLSCQGGPIEWVGLHRIHHKYSDTAQDPHDSNKGFWWSHVAWMMHHIPAQDDVPRYTKDIGTDKFYLFCQKFMVPLQIVLGLLLYAWGTMALPDNPYGGWSFVIWGVFLRLAVVFHCTWFVNSATHKFGYQSQESHDYSKNCWWVALVTYGEGWHNNHHAEQYSARHGWAWWEIDPTWGMIQVLKVLGLAKNIKLPAQLASST